MTLVSRGGQDWGKCVRMEELNSKVQHYRLKSRVSN